MNTELILFVIFGLFAVAAVASVLESKIAWQRAHLFTCDGRSFVGKILSGSVSVDGIVVNFKKLLSLYRDGIKDGGTVRLKFRDAPDYYGPGSKATGQVTLKVDNFSESIQIDVSKISYFYRKPDARDK